LNPFPARQMQQPIPGRVSPLVASCLPAYAIIETLDNLKAAMGGAVIHNHDFHRRMRLSESALNGFANPTLGVETGISTETSSDIPVNRD
jgi:hypothetical protein